MCSNVLENQIKRMCFGDNINIFIKRTRGRILVMGFQRCTQTSDKACQQEIPEEPSYRINRLSAAEWNAIWGTNFRLTSDHACLCVHDLYTGRWVGWHKQYWLEMDSPAQIKPPLKSSNKEEKELLFFFCCLLFVYLLIFYLASCSFK